jgi:hypothetical protein
MDDSGEGENGADVEAILYLNFPLVDALTSSHTPVPCVQTLLQRPLCR